jgi:predicted sulfurtransferase
MASKVIVLVEGAMLSDKQKLTLEVTSLSELKRSLTEKLALKNDKDIKIEVFDKDFDEWSVLGDFASMGGKAKLKISYVPERCKAKVEEETAQAVKAKETEQALAMKAAAKAKKAGRASGKLDAANGMAIIKGNAQSVAFRSLPPIPDQEPDEEGNYPCTLVLFYQYIEPCWTRKEHKTALVKVTSLAKENGITGRGRCAEEGLNCTLTGSAEGVRNFCNGLREWNKTFLETDFKLTDGMPFKQRFKSFNIRKTEELVNYGLGGGRVAPSIKQFSGVHLEADEYHEMLSKKDNNTVVIDVRNAYESAIGHFAPPPGGAELIDPKMRNSHDFAGWLNLKETQQKLTGKKVMMYCTGGIRCERAAALINQMTTVSHDFKTDGVYELRGGIERYMKTFPEGGLWKGKNYLFDRRQEQVPENKTKAALDEDVESACVGCGEKWAKYKGQFKCAGMNGGICGVPIIVCDACAAKSNEQTEFHCDLCKEGYTAPTDKPDLAAAKRKIAELEATGELEQARAPSSKPAEPMVVDEGANQAEEESGMSWEAKKKRKKDAKEARRQARREAEEEPSACRRVFVGKLPLLINATELKEALCTHVDACGGDTSHIKLVKWVTDHKTGGFFGSAFVEMSTMATARALVIAGARSPQDGIKGLTMKGKKLKINLAPVREGEVWPPADHQHLERPPVM